MRAPVCITRFVGKEVQSTFENDHPRGKCELCSRRATKWCEYAWGVAQLCEKCLAKEVAP